MTTAEVITGIRYRVGDIPGSKYTEARILELINESLDDLSRKLDILKAEITLPVIPYQRSIEVPDKGFIKLTRVRYENTRLQLLSYDEMDRVAGWETAVGTKLQAVVFNLQNPQHLTLYPLLDSSIRQGLDTIDADGIITDIVGMHRSQLDGVVMEVKVNGVDINAANFHTITINYIKRVPRVEDLPEMYRTPLIYYVAGMLLLDDTRAENINKGLLFQEKYQNELGNLQKLSSKNYQEVDIPSVSYRTGFGDEYAR